MSHRLRTTARHTLAALAALALLAAPAAAHAQFTGTVTHNGATTDATPFNYSVGPTSQTVTNVPQLPGQALAVTAFCVDFGNAITNNTTFQANITSLGAVLGGQATLANTRHPAGLAGYQKAAFLIDQFQSPGVAGLTGAARNQTWGALQGAIWAIFTPSAASLDAGTSTSDPTVIEYWQQQASDFAAGAQFAAYDYSRFYVITDASAAGKATGGVQEFMTASPGLPMVTPEPGTVLLLGAGLVAVAGAATRRRGGNADGGAAAGAEA